MTDVILAMIPMMLGSAIAPIWIILVLLMLRSPHGLVKAILFVAGASVVRLLQGFIFGYLFKSSDHVGGSSGPSPVVSALLLMIGILLLITAVKTLRKEEDPDAPPPKWMTLVDSASPSKLFILGGVVTLVAAKLWVFTLSAIGVIRDANLSESQSWTAFIVYMLGAQSLVLLPILIYLVLPSQFVKLLGSATDWLQKYNRIITLAVSIIFGILFLWKGTSGLLS
ncbi:MAG: GAP family protein [Oscillatoriales cyanobacterium RM2_1_1]|nr:GAP family protein [Oscillatoriales cyanobacterium SM2_3_0]NJO44269.1 GAP family protein [Oscillatoriales cyanobacterium RM2_1_1]